MSLPYQHQAFVIYMDNYFNNVPLFLKLRKLGIGAYGTARQNCSGFPKELKVGKTLTGKQKLDYHFITGMEVGMTASNQEVLAVLWMDNAPVTMLMTVHNIHGSKSHVITEKKCPEILAAMQLESGNCLSRVNLSNHFQFLPVLMTTINLWGVLISRISTAHITQPRLSLDATGYLSFSGFLILHF